METCQLYSDILASAGQKLFGERASSGHGLSDQSKGSGYTVPMCALKSSSRTLIKTDTFMLGA